MKYTFKYKKYLLWRTIKNVKGHALDGDRMDIFLDDGIISISGWSKYDMKLGSDFIIAQKESMENETGQPISMKKG